LIARVRYELTKRAILTKPLNYTTSSARMSFNACNCTKAVIEAKSVNFVAYLSQSSYWRWSALPPSSHAVSSGLTSLPSHWINYRRSALRNRFSQSAMAVMYSHAYRPEGYILQSRRSTSSTRTSSNRLSTASENPSDRRCYTGRVSLVGFRVKDLEEEGRYCRFANL
jgi:hypothetical protein